VTGDYDRVTPPGQEGRITVTLNTIKFNKPITKSVTIITNDPKNKRVMLTMKAAVRSPVEIRPTDRADFRVYHGEGGRKLLGLILREDSAAEVVVIRSNSDLFTVDWGPWAPPENPGEEELEIFGDAGGRPYRLEIGLSEKAGVGYHSGRITIHLDGTRQKELDIKALARVMGRIHFTPQWLYFGSVDAGERQQVERLLELRSHGDIPFAVTGVEYEGLPVTWEIRPLENGRGADILFRWDGEEPAGIHKGRLMVRTDNPAQPELEIPFSINVLAQKKEEAEPVANRLKRE